MNKTIKTVLINSDLYHTPGYCGYCPQYKFQLGKNFGQTTCDLLKDKSVATSGRPVLADILPGPPHDLEEREERLIETRKGEKFKPMYMMPGYSGYIPKSLNNYGNRYAEGCRKSISKFECDYRYHWDKKLDLLTHNLPNPEPDLPPLKALRKKAAPYKLQKEVAMLGSPYNMDNDDCNKTFISGYQGFVPRSRYKLGLGFPVQTHVSLNEFTDACTQHRALKYEPVTVRLPEPEPMPPAHEVYPVTSGIVPHYTGHVPGYKYKYGATYGFNTENALQYPLTART